MANTYKDIIITPSRGSNTADPNISFRGGNTSTNTEIVLRVYPDANGTLSFEGSAGQLFSVTNDLTNTIFSVNDVSGIPSLEVYANGNVAMVHYDGNLGVGTASPTSKLHVVGNVNVTTGINTTTINVTTVNAATLLTRDGINVSAAAINSYTTANAAANTARVSANSGSTISGRSLNFVNTATITVNVAANPSDATNANISFTSTTINVKSNTPPSNPYEGMVWFDTETIKTFIYYDSFWVEVGTSEVSDVYGRDVYWANTSVLASNASAQVNVAAYKSYVLMKMTTSNAAWVRIYSDPASRTSDSSRSMYVDPSPGSGVIAEIITSGETTQKVTPFLFGGNLEDSPTSNIYFTITNLSGASQSINTSITITRLEN